MKHLKMMMVFAALGISLLSGCGKKEAAVDLNTEQLVTEAATESVEVLETETELEEETEEIVVEPKLREGMNPLTGEMMDDPAKAKLRPVSFMMGNTKDAMPQYGASKADVIYEVPAEGGLTRLMLIFQDYANLPTIMSSRSCRHYFAYFSNEFDAIYVHYGQAIYATEMLKSMDDLNGLDGDLANVTFFRDSSRKSPHNAYVNGESIVAGIEKRGYRTELAPQYPGHYYFAKDNEEITLDNGEDAVVVAPGFSVNKPWFEYDESTGLYKRYQYGASHVDGGTNEQLAFKNIIFQVCDYEMEPDNKYLNVKTASWGGIGTYITNGKAVDITYVKKVEDGVTHYYDENGEELVLNQGKTCVCVVLNDAVEEMKIYPTKEAFESR